MKVIVTGGTGFIGHYLTRALVSRGDEVIATHFDSGSPLEGERIEGATYLRLDISSREDVTAMVDREKPDQIYHLAGQAYPVPSWNDPAGTFRVNVLGTIYLFEAVRKSGRPTVIANACSGAEYGDRIMSPIPEESVLRPLSPYGVSKAAHDMLVYQYNRSYSLPFFSLRLFGTTGPGKAGDALNDFASQVAMAENNGGTVKVGRLDVIRDISDVRDVVNAFMLVAGKGTPGEPYNIGSGKHYRIGDLLDMLLSMATTEVGYTVESSRIRPADEVETYPEITRIRNLGYVPKYDMKQTMYDLLEFWRSRQDKTVATRPADIRHAVN